MSREKQIEEMAKIIHDSIDADNPCLDEKYGGFSCFGCDYLDKGYCQNDIERARGLYTAGYRKQEWISVEERLPENDSEKHWKERQRYLVYTEPNGLMYVAKYGYKEYGWWSDGGGYVLDEKNYRKVTHWMPLPEAPKMKGDSDAR